MTEEQIRQIIREELALLLGQDHFVFSKQIQILDGRNIQTAKGTGTKIGTEGGATGQKLGFYGVTPIVQRVHIADPTGGTTTDAEARTAINSILTALETLGFLRTS